MKQSDSPVPQTSNNRFRAGALLALLVIAGFVIVSMWIIKLLLTVAFLVILFLLFRRKRSR